MAKYQRILGLDVGTVTVGVAVSDLLGWTAQGLETLKIDVDKGDFGFDRLLEIIHEQDVNKVVIGLPKNMNNTLGPRAEASMDYGAKLQELIPTIEIIYEDERLTSTQANRMLTEEANVSRKKRKQVIDKLAAVIILQTYLDRQ